MAVSVVPEATRLAARRGFIRTSTQTLSSMIPTAGVVLGLTGDWWLAAGLGVASAVVSAGLAGAASYFSIISKGVPDEYVTAE